MDFSRYISLQRCRNCFDDSDIVLDKCSGDMICRECGMIVLSQYVLDGPEWNNYSSERESGKNNSRIGWRDKNHPENTLGSRIGRCPKTNFLDKSLVTRQIYIEKSSKEKRYDYVSNEFDQYLNHEKHGLNKRVIEYAKNIWYELFGKKEIIYRGEHRKAIICACVYRAAMQCNSTLLRQDIQKIGGVSDKMFTIGDRVVQTHLNHHNSSKLLQLKTTNDTTDQIRTVFGGKINKLGLPFLFFVPTCTKIYVKCKKEIDEFLDIVEKSKISSVIYYTLTLKGIHKEHLKNLLKICNITKPTLIRGYNMIKKHLTKEYIMELTE